MTISTVGVWAGDTPTQIQKDDINAQAALMATQGKTDDIPVVQYNTPVFDQKTVTRTWTTTADAEEWVSFIVAFTPVSIEIIP